MDTLPTFTIYNGDSRAVLKQLPSESVHCCVSSPPYFLLRDYGVTGQIGLEKSREEHIDNLVQVFDEVRRVLHPSGVLFLNYGDCYINKQLQMMPARVAIALQDAGWILRSDIIWSKPSALPESVKDRPSKSHEYIFLLAKSEKYFYDSEAIKEPVADSTAPRLLRAVSTNHKAVNGAPGQTPHTLSQPRPNTRRDTNAPEVGGVDMGIWAGRYGDSSNGLRNKRTVWSIPPQSFNAKRLGFGDANHFATFPETLPEICIKAGTSDKGVCSSCGAPWQRQIAPSADYAQHLGKGHNDHINDGERGMMQPKREGFKSMTSEYRTTGWQPTCRCNAGVSPATVLDPFAGAGTTLLVANRLGRHGIGVELNPDYCRLAERRIRADAPLLAIGGIR